VAAISRLWDLTSGFRRTNVATEVNEGTLSSMLTTGGEDGRPGDDLTRSAAEEPDLFKGGGRCGERP
jgi:hypothetical protein